MRPVPLFAVVLTAFFTFSTAHAQDSWCNVKNGTAAEINDHFDGDPMAENHNTIDYFHYNKAGKADFHLKATAIGWVNHMHAISQYYRFSNGSYQYIAASEAGFGDIPPFEGLKIYKGTTLIAKQICVNGWQPFIDPSISVLPNDMDGSIAATFFG